MNFKDIYSSCKSQIKEAILRMWEDTAPKMVEMYKEQLDEIIAANVSENIVVEDMSQWEPIDGEWRRKGVINDCLWPKDLDFEPFKHQYLCWDTLLSGGRFDNGKSIVVTTGTGSGKTECFMIPLIHDLAFGQERDREQGVEAIFLYPLNALMENQKDRISKYIGYSQNNGGRQLTYAVYNGSTPENETDIDGELKDYEVGDRSTIRREKPNIILTNPSMLEYMLLREKDSKLFSESLKWIVIDETHTFKGSNGAELALLLRRVLNACGKTADQIRFATSSATIGNSDEGLKQFITDITGQDDVAIIKGWRTTPNIVDCEKAKLLHAKNFVALNELIPDGSIEDKLAKIDSWADAGLKVRLHYYIKSLNQGLFVDLDGDTTDDGKFKLLTKIPFTNECSTKGCVLNAYYCTKCGAVLGRGILEDDGSIHRDIRELTQLDVDSFEDDYDNDEDNEGSTQGNVGDANRVFIGIASDTSCSSRVNIQEGKLHMNIDGKYVMVTMSKEDTEDECPCCGATTAFKKSPIKSFHMSADFLGRLITPLLLQQSSKHKDAETNPDLPSEGRKFITFVDSRQGAAQNTLKQNIETEDVWVTGVLYRELFKKLPLTQEQIDELQKEALLALQNGDTKRAKELLNPIDPNDNGSFYITWQEAIDALLNDSNCERMFLAFAIKEDEDYEVSKKKYTLSALYRVMHRRPGGGKNSPENWGLVTTHYPTLKDRIDNTDLPQAITDFNNLVADNLKIQKEDWYHYAKLYIDHYIRSNEKLYFKLYTDGKQIHNVEWKRIDIKSIRSYRTEEGKRRPMTELSLGNNRMSLMLCRLLGKSSVRDLTQQEEDAINSVLAALTKLMSSCGIVSNSESIRWKWTKDGDREFDQWVEDTGYNGEVLKYMNLSHIAFKLYESNVWFDPNLKIPLDTTFKGYSPYANLEGNRYDVLCERLNWSHFDCKYDGDIREWFNANRGAIQHKWTAKLERILDYIRSKRNTLYIQAEHTAQVPRSIIENKTQKFINGELNIMACSTTMEMGVDIGDLDLVVMNNVPPYPANYKQRAGRAGRAKQNKSACITFCGSDAIGSAVMANPMDEIINREVLAPKVDLKKAAKQLVQRHVNSLLLREFIMRYGGMAIGRDDENDQGLRICEFFSIYQRNTTQNPNTRRKNYYGCIEHNNQRAFPSSYQSIVNADIHQNSIYRQFCNFLDWLQSTTVDDNFSRQFNRDDIKAAIDKLKRSTIADRESTSNLIEGTKAAIKSIAEDIDKELSAIKDIWDDDSHLRNSHPYKIGIIYYWNFIDILAANLMSYLSNHQFTPNANMPIGIVELIIDENETVWKKTENPTRDLRTALSEYTPWKRVSANGRSYLIGGIRRNRTRPIENIKKCRNGHTWTTGDVCPECSQPQVPWEKFGNIMKLITPTGYYVSDVSRQTSREFVPTNIGVQLIGAGNWRDNDSHKLITWRTNENETNSQILYFDMGQHGYGYCICRECGYAIPATRNYSNVDEAEIVNLMYQQKTDRNGRIKFVHDYRYKCEVDDNDPTSNILLNIVLGGTIQTDYCELAIYDPHILPLTQMAANDETRKIGNTLGVLLCIGLSKMLGCDRGELDFVTRDQNGKLSICIFDVAKGGSGRSKQLPEMLLKLLDDARKQLDNVHSIDQIIDRESMRYAEFIDIKATKEWLDEEYRHRITRPEEIPESAQLSSYYDIATDVTNNASSGDVEIYVDGANIDKWNYRSHDEVDWKTSREDIYRTRTNKHKLVVLNAPRLVSVEQKVILSNMGDWAQLYRANWDNKAMIPLARVNGHIYVTSNISHTLLDENWGGADVWRLPDNDYPIEASEWSPGDGSNLSDGPIIIKDGIAMSSSKLYDTIIKYSNQAGACLTRFAELAQGSTLSFEYTDKYLTSQLGMIITGQFISRVISEVGCGDNYSLDIKILTDPRKDNIVYSVDDDNRDLWSSIVSAERAQYLRSVLSKRFRGRFRVTTIDKHVNMPHYRRLKVTSSNGYELYVIPDGGFEFGWKFDKYALDNRDITTEECDINTKIQLYADATGGIVFYTALKTNRG